MQTHYVI